MVPSQKINGHFRKLYGPWDFSLPQTSFIVVDDRLVLEKIKSFIQELKNTSLQPSSSQHMPVKLFHALMSPPWKPISHWQCSMKNLIMVFGICPWQNVIVTAMIAKPKCVELTLWRHQSWEHINQLLLSMIWTSSKVSYEVKSKVNGHFAQQS